MGRTPRWRVDEPGIGLDVEHGLNDIGKSEGRGRRTALRSRKRRQERKG